MWAGCGPSKRSFIDIRQVAGGEEGGAQMIRKPTGMLLSFAEAQTLPFSSPGRGGRGPEAARKQPA